MSVVKFNDESIKNVLESIKKAHKGLITDPTHPDFDILKGGCNLVSATCVSVTVNDGKVCIELPLGLGTHCFSIPVSIPVGTVGEACLSICTTWGIPTGVKVTVVFAGVTVVNQSFGKC